MEPSHAVKYSGIWKLIEVGKGDRDEPLVPKSRDLTAAYATIAALVGK